MTEKQQADFERYMHIVPEKIQKYAPEFIGDEDFEQDCYLHLVEYISTNHAVNQLEHQKDRGIRIHTNMAHFICRHARQWSNEPLLVLAPNDSDPYMYVRRNEIYIAINDAIDCLPYASHQNVIRLRFGFATGNEMTYTEIGHMMQRSRERIRHIENRAMQMFRNPAYQAGRYVRKYISFEFNPKVHIVE